MQMSLDAFNDMASTQVGGPVANWALGMFKKTQLFRHFEDLLVIMSDFDEAGAFLFYPRIPSHPQMYLHKQVMHSQISRKKKCALQFVLL